MSKIQLIEFNDDDVQQLKNQGVISDDTMLRKSWFTQKCMHEITIKYQPMPKVSLIKRKCIQIIQYQKYLIIYTAEFMDHVVYVLVIAKLCENWIPYGFEQRTEF